MLGTIKMNWGDDWEQVGLGNMPALKELHGQKHGLLTGLPSHILLLLAGYLGIALGNCF